MARNEKLERTVGFMDLLVLMLSVYILVTLALDTMLHLPPQVDRLIKLSDDFICVVFFVDFVVQFVNARNKWKYMRWGWIDLLSSVPAYGVLRVGRVFRLVQLFRLFRVFKSLRSILHHIFRNKIQGTLMSVAVIGVLTILLSSVLILSVETDPRSNIKTAEDALWWSYATITTVGYGDCFPVTTAGRIIAMVLMTVGVAIFGTFTAYVSSWFVKSDVEKEIETLQEHVDEKPGKHKSHVQPHHQ